MASDPLSADQFYRGARKAASKLARNMIPAMPVPEPEVENVKREAYLMAVSNCHKPWARRYLRDLRIGRVSW